MAHQQCRSLLSSRVLRSVSCNSQTANTVRTFSISTSSTVSSESAASAAVDVAAIWTESEPPSQRAKLKSPKTHFCWTRFDSDKGELVRDFVNRSLYDPTEGYFNQQNRILSSSAEVTDIDHLISDIPLEPLDFGACNNEAQYRMALNMRYMTRTGAWLTPVEIFQPYYGRSIANWLLAKLRKKNFSSRRGQRFRKKLRHNLSDDKVPEIENFTILELGGGNGTCAINILDYLRDHHPEVYQQCTYVVCEMSSELHELQKKRLAHHTNFKSVQKSAADWDEKIHDRCFIVGLEVLDNMAHDKVVGNIFGDHSELQQVRVVESEAGEFSEVLEPLSDPVIKRYFKALEGFEHQEKIEMLGAIGRLINFMRRWKQLAEGKDPWAQDKDSVTFVPTVAFQFFERLNKLIPKHHCFFADFDYLPETIQGRNAPLVAADHYNGRCNDHDTYLVPIGKADIFFPTDFPALKHVYLKTCRRDSRIMSHEHFVAVHGGQYIDECICQNGYNPFREDYQNMSYFVS